MPHYARILHNAAHINDDLKPVLTQSPLPPIKAKHTLSERKQSDATHISTKRNQYHIHFKVRYSTFDSSNYHSPKNDTPVSEVKRINPINIGAHIGNLKPIQNRNIRRKSTQYTQHREMPIQEAKKEVSPWSRDITIYYSANIKRAISRLKSSIDSYHRTKKM